MPPSRLAGGRRGCRRRRLRRRSGFERRASAIFSTHDVRAAAAAAGRSSGAGADIRATGGDRPGRSLQRHQKEGARAEPHELRCLRRHRFGGQVGLARIVARPAAGRPRAGAARVFRGRAHLPDLRRRRAASCAILAGLLRQWHRAAGKNPVRADPGRGRGRHAHPHFRRGRSRPARCPGGRPLYACRGAAHQNFPARRREYFHAASRCA